jgi:hypothetical protein
LIVADEGADPGGKERDLRVDAKDHIEALSDERLAERESVAQRGAMTAFAPAHHQDGDSKPEEHAGNEAANRREKTKLDSRQIAGARSVGRAIENGPKPDRIGRGKGTAGQHEGRDRQYARADHDKTSETTVWRSHEGEPSR